MPSKSGLKKYMANTSWMFADKLFHIVFGLGVSIWFARYLGPEQFGIFNYALSFVALFSVIATLGLEKLVTKELLSNPEDDQLTIGTSFVLRFVGAVILVPLAALSVSIIRPESEIIFLLVILFSLGFFFKSFEVIKYWFESHVQAKYSSIAQTVAFTISLGAKIVLILSEAPLIAFAYLTLAESVVLAGLLVFIFLHKGNKLTLWKVTFSKLKYLFREAWPLILAGAVFVFFTRIDQVMLGNMVGDESVGIYAVAVKLSESWMFIPSLIAVSFFPAMLNARKSDYSLYLARTQHLLNLMAVLGVVVGAATIFLASPVINLLFGFAYSESSLILIIHIWGMLFNAISIISFRYFLAEGLQMYSFYRAFAGLILNVILNLILIPLYGAVGAAIATVISQAVAAYLLNSISPKTRPMFVMQTKALLLVGSIGTLKQINELRRAK